MKKILSQHNLELGQVIPFVVLMMFAIIAMVALIIDGGAIISNRRTAQAAADAGALAGVQRVCAFKDDGEAVARYYALLNGAADELLDVDVDPDAKQVTVIATVETNTAFFSRIFGEENLTATARAVAGCYPPGMTNRLLPIAFWWQSSPKLLDDDGEIKNEDLCSVDDPDCQFWMYEYDYLIDQLKNTPITEQPFPYIYVVADSIKVCQSEEVDDENKTICYDFDKDGSGGNRVWLNLSPIEGSNVNLKKVMQDGMNNDIRLPAWINGDPGVVSSMYQPKTYNELDIIEEGMKMHQVTVPWYDLFCENDPENNCEVPPNNYTEGPVYYYLHNKNQHSYRIRGFSTFIITCVTQGSKCSYGDCIPSGEGDNDTQHAQCPGYLAAYPDKKDKDASKDAIEGYFVINPPEIQSSGTSNFFAGDYIISLSE